VNDVSLMLRKRHLMVFFVSMCLNRSNKETRAINIYIPSFYLRTDHEDPITVYILDSKKKYFNLYRATHRVSTDCYS
jgi:hypothetical protein